MRRAVALALLAAALVCSADALGVSYDTFLGPIPETKAQYPYVLDLMFDPSQGGAAETDEYSFAMLGGHRLGTDWASNQGFMPVRCTMFRDGEVEIGSGSEADNIAHCRAAANLDDVAAPESVDTGVGGAEPSDYDSTHGMFFDPAGSRTVTWTIQNNSIQLYRKNVVPATTSDVAAGRLSGTGDWGGGETFSIGPTHACSGWHVFTTAERDDFFNRPLIVLQNLPSVNTFVSIDRFKASSNSGFIVINMGASWGTGVTSSANYDCDVIGNPSVPSSIEYTIENGVMGDAGELWLIGQVVGQNYGVLVSYNAIVPGGSVPAGTFYILNTADGAFVPTQVILDNSRDLVYVFASPATNPDTSEFAIFRFAQSITGGLDSGYTTDLSESVFRYVRATGIGKVSAVAIDVAIGQIFAFHADSEVSRIIAQNGENGEPVEFAEVDVDQVTPNAFSTVASISADLYTATHAVFRDYEEHMYVVWNRKPSVTNYYIAQPVIGRVKAYPHDNADLDTDDKALVFGGFDQCWSQSTCDQCLAHNECVWCASPVPGLARTYPDVRGKPLDYVQCMPGSDLGIALPYDNSMCQAGNVTSTGAIGGQCSLSVAPPEDDRDDPPQSGPAPGPAFPWEIAGATLGGVVFVGAIAAFAASKSKKDSDKDLEAAEAKLAAMKAKKNTPEGKAALAKKIEGGGSSGSRRGKAGGSAGSRRGKAGDAGSTGSRRNLARGPAPPRPGGSMGSRGRKAGGGSAGSRKGGRSHK